MPNRSTRDVMQGLNLDGTKQVAPPTRSAFDPPPPGPAKAAPVQATPQPVSTPSSTPIDNPTSDLSATGAVKAIKNRQYAEAKAIDDQSG